MFKAGKKFCLMGEHEKHLPPIENTKAIIIKPGYVLDYVFRPDRHFFIDELDSLGVEGKKIMDVGTGAGFVAIAAAKMGALLVAAIERDEPSAEWVKQNVELNEVGDKVKIFKNIFDTYPEQFDIIACNLANLPEYLEVLPDLEPRLVSNGTVLLQAGGDLNIMHVTIGGYPDGELVLKDAITKTPLKIDSSVTRGKFEYWYLRRK